MTKSGEEARLKTPKTAARLALNTARKINKDKKSGKL